MARKTIQRLEESQQNAWPALQTLFINGWLMRFAEGFTRRANSILPHWTTPSIQLERAIARAEAVYAARELDCTFRVAPTAIPERLDDVLAARGYTLEGKTAVLVCDLAARSRSSISSEIKLAGRIDEAWLAGLCHVQRYRGTIPMIIEAIVTRIPTRTAFLQFQKGSTASGYALLVFEGSGAGIYELCVPVDRRRAGIGRALVQAGLSAAKDAGAKYFYAAVELENDAGQSLFRSQGMEELYTYHYRRRTKL